MDTDQEKASRLTAIAEWLGAGGSDGWAGVQSLVRELEAMEPGAAQRIRDRLAQRHIARRLSDFAAR